MHRAQFMFPSWLGTRIIHGKLTDNFPFEPLELTCPLSSDQHSLEDASVRARCW